MAEITSEGIIQKTYEEYLTEFQDGFRAIFGDQMVFDPETPQGQITSLMALAAVEFEGSIIDVGRSLDIAQAVGQQLDDLTSILAVYRRPASKTTVNVIMTGTPLTLITAGAEVSSSEGDVFSLSEDVQLDGDGNGTGLFVAKEFGAIAVSIGDISDIVTPVTGWDTATNSVAGTTGSDMETDAEFTRRYFNQIAVASVSLMESVVSGVQAVDGVTHAVGVENVTDVITETNGVFVPAHGFVMSVVGGGDSDIAEAIRKYKSLGSSSTQMVECTLTGTNGTVIPKGSTAYVAAADNTAGIDLYFETIEEVTIPPSTTIDAFLRCRTEAGFQFDASKTMVIDPAVSGWSTCTNKNAHRFVHQEVDAFATDGTLIQKVPIDFLRVQDIEMYVRVEATTNPQFPLDGIDQITNAILSYFNGTDVFIPDRFELDGLQIAEDVYKSRMYTPINSVRGHYITNVTLQKRYDDWASGDYVVGDKVFYASDNLQYVCILDTTAQQPPSNATHWSLDTGAEEVSIALDERAVISTENIIVSLS
jgi:uncharacterized phage protein gp47/JayE